MPKNFQEKSDDDAAVPVSSQPPEQHAVQDEHRHARNFSAWLKEIVIIVSVALVLSFLIKTFLFRAFFIPSGSMEETLQINDRIFVNLLVPEPMALKRGDIVVFRDTQGWLPPAIIQPDNPASWFKNALIFVGLLPDESQQHLVKRVIGVGGDRVVCCDSDGRVTVNGKALQEPYLYPGANPSDRAFDVTVPEGKLWVMGDHRNASADSREHQQGMGHGFVDVDDVEGKAAFIAWPLDRIGLVDSHPEVFSSIPESSGTSSLPRLPEDSRR